MLVLLSPLLSAACPWPDPAAGHGNHRSPQTNGVIERFFKVHQRVNVRVLELIDGTSGSRIELEGNRLPVTHGKDVIHVLTSGGF